MRIFYRIRDLSTEEILDRARKACKVSFNWWADKLDVSKSYHRQKMDVSLEYVLAMVPKRDYLVRFFVEYPINKLENDGNPFCGIGFRIFGEIDYFLWIQFPRIYKDRFFGDLDPMD